MRGTIQVDNNFALGVVIIEGGVGTLDRRKGEAARVNQGNELAGFDQSTRLCENVSMVRAALAGKKRQQRENAGMVALLKEREASAWRPHPRQLTK